MEDKWKGETTDWGGRPEERWIDEREVVLSMRDPKSNPKNNSRIPIRNRSA